MIMMVRLSNLESQNNLFIYSKHSYEALFSKLGLGNNQASFHQVEGPIRFAAFFNLLKTIS
jgi:citrate lyase synthetase